METFWLVPMAGMTNKPNVKTLTNDGLREWLVLQGSKAEITDLDRSSGPGDEDVVALEVAVNDWRWPRVQEVEPFYDLPTPGFQDSLIDLLEPSQVRLQRAWGHHLRDEHDALFRPKSWLVLVTSHDNVAKLKVEKC